MADGEGRLSVMLDPLAVEGRTLVVADRPPHGLPAGPQRTVYENGIRVPCFIRWPNGFRVPARIEAPAAYTDILPTVMEACRCDVTAAPAIDGSPRYKLYDVAADPGEVADLSKRRSDIVADLRQAYDAWFTNVCSGCQSDPKKE